MKVTLFFGPAASGKTQRLLGELEKVHREDPFSYLFVGPSGDHVRHFRESFLSRVGTIPSSSFQAMDQFAVSVFTTLKPGSYHIEDYIVRLEIGNILEKMGKSELVDSSLFVDYVLEMIHDVKEQNGFKEIFAQEDEIVSTLEDIYGALEERFSSNLIFDTFDAYTRLEELAGDIKAGEFGRYLFVDGFHDFSPAMEKFFECVFPSFEEIYMSVPADPARVELYSQTNSIGKFIDRFREKRPDTQLSKIYLEQSHYPEPLGHFMSNLFCERKTIGSCPAVQTTLFPDVFSEIERVARRVKELLVTGYEPGEIALVASDFQIYDRLLRQKLEEYGVPYRSEGDEPLLSALSIKKLILPLETAVLGFPPDKLIAMGDYGYGGEMDAKFFESVAAMSRIIYDRSQLRLTLASRRKAWLERLEKYVEFTLKRRTTVLALAEDELESAPAAELAETARRVEEDLIPAVEKIFKNLECFKSMRKRPVRAYREMFLEWESILSLVDSYTEFEGRDGQSGELQALEKFLGWVLPELERILLFMKREEIAPPEYYSYLMLLLRKENYALSRSKANRVEIQSLLKSRFSKKRVKFFLGFVDGAYPFVKLNPLYSFTQYSETRPRDLLLTKEKQQRLNLYLAISAAQEAIEFTLPESTLNGDPILPSPYLKDIMESSGNTLQRRGLVGGRREGLIPELKDAMSELELKIAAARYFPSSSWEELKERFELDELEPLLSDFKRDFRWVVEARERLRDFVGNTFSYSRFKAYSDCPFQFFLSYVISLDQRPDYIFQLSPLEEGNVYHAVLKDYFSGKLGDWENSLKENLTKHILHESEIVFKFEYARLREILEEYVTSRESKRPRYMDGDYFPFAFEQGFGIANTPPVKLLEDVFLRGKIDRLDLDEESGSVYLCDYKRGNSGEKKQLLLYSLAADKLFAEKGYSVAGGVFKTLTGKTVNSSAFKVERSPEGKQLWKSASGKNDESEQSEDGLRKWVKTLTDELYAGQFTPVYFSDPKPCFNCRFNKLKRVATWRDGKEDSYEE